MSDKLKNEIAELAEFVMAGTDFFLVGIDIKGSRTPEVWVYVDGAERGVTMDECAEISNELGFLMDAHDLFSGAHRLNVSSPGLSRPLTDRRQYPKNKGRRAKVKYKDDEGYHKLEGVLENLSEDEIVIVNDDGSTVLPFEQVVETKIIPSIN